MYIVNFIFGNLEPNIEEWQYRISDRNWQRFVCEVRSFPCCTHRLNLWPMSEREVIEAETGAFTIHKEIAQRRDC